MRLRILFSVLTAILLASCTKEISREQENDPPADSVPVVKNRLLIRLVEYDERMPGDSSVDTYVYDNNKRVVNVKSESFGPGNLNVSYSNTEKIFYRDAGGIINRIAVIDRHYEGALFTRIDSAVLEFFYDQASKHYTHCFQTINLVPIYAGQDESIRDSVAYTYDSKDRIVLMQRFRKDTSINVIFEAQRIEYTYDVNGNMIKVADNENFDNRGDPLVETIIEYDNKNSPFASLGNDGILLAVEYIGFPSPNNMIKQSTGGVNIFLAKYEYDADGYPVKVEATYTDIPGKITTYFYYQ